MTSSVANHDHEIRPLRAGDAAGVLAVLNAAFTRQSSSEWYAWKHLRGPWGPSVGWVAEDSAGTIVAARTITPWEVWSPDSAIAIERAMDGAVAPSAQRQGLFSRCVRTEMDLLAAGGRDARLIYSTSVPASREAYRKLGWTISEVSHSSRLARPAARAAAQLAWGDALEQGELPRGATWGTAWNAAALRWRTHHASGRRYESVRLRHATAHHGLIFRRASLRGIRALAVTYAWGPEREVATLVAAAATRIAAPLVLSAGVTHGVGPTWVVGGSTVSAWAPPMRRDHDIPDLRHLPLQLADLEGAM